MKRTYMQKYRQGLRRSELLPRPWRLGSFLRSGRGLAVGFAILILGVAGVLAYRSFDAYVSATPRKIIQVVAGAWHGIALDSSGVVYSWGQNTRGQLGNGTTAGSLAPVSIDPSGTAMAGKKITSVATGGYHTLALASDGKVYAWGQGVEGQLGNGGWADQTSPVEVTTVGTPMADKTIIAISAGAFHSLALASDGTVYGWGRNDYGQLGDGSTDYSEVPVALATAGTPLATKTITGISAGGYHGLAVTSEGLVYGWGRNNNGQVGDNTTTGRTKPVAVSVASTPMVSKKIVSISTGSAHSHAVSSDGLVFSWGLNSSGQLGNNSTTQRNRPVSVNTNTTPMNGKYIVTTSASDNQSLALDQEGQVYSWGNNTAGHLGDNTTTGRLRPVSVATTGTPMAGKTIISISMTGDQHAVALGSDGAVYSWGGNSEGQLGNGTTTGSYVPVQTSFSLIGTPSAPKNISSTPGNGSIGLIWKAPIVTYGQSITGYSLQYRILGNSTWTTTSISGAAISYTQAGLVNGQKYQVRLAAATSTGVGDYSPIFLASPRNMTITNVSPEAGTPSGGQDVTIAGTEFALKEKDVVQIAAGYKHMLALDSDGIIYSWGLNIYGQLGDGTSTNRPYPVAVNANGGALAGKHIVKIAAGYDTSFAIDSDGKIYSWGDNNYGQLGRGAITQRLNPTPQEVESTGTPMSGKAIVEVTSNQATTVALDSDGVLYSWGYNVHGELGSGTTGGYDIQPDAVLSSGSSIAGKRIVSISSGEYYFLVIDEDGVVHSWGWNQYSELGSGTANTSSNKPALVSVNGTPMAGKTIVDVDGGIWHSIAVDSDGNVYTWGDGEFSQLGNGSHGAGVFSVVPVSVDTSGTPMEGKRIVDVSAGGNDFWQTDISPSSHSLAMAEDGTVYAWGTNHTGEIGIGEPASGTQHDKPVAVDVSSTPMSGKAMVQISAGMFYSVALSSEGRVYEWGDNSHGQLGDDSTTIRKKPVAVSDATPSALAPSIPVVTFDGVLATNISLVDSTTIMARTPAHIVGAVDVVADLGEGTPRHVAVASNGYTYANVPGVPISLTATPADNGVVLGWAAPASNGGATITEYVVQYSPDEGMTWLTYADGTSASTTVTVPTPILNSTTTYSFRVSAVNAVGQGAWSNTATARVRYITLTAPSTVDINVTPMGGARMSSSSHEVIVSTNGVLGYQLTLSSATSDRDLTKGSSKIIPSTGTQVTPTNLIGSSWGYRVNGIGGFGASTTAETNTTASSYTWSGIPVLASPEIIRIQTSAVSNQSTTIWYGINVATDQSSGMYSGTVTYTAVTRD